MHDESRREVLRKFIAAGAVAATVPLVTAGSVGAQVFFSGCEQATLDWDALPIGRFGGSTVAGITVTASTVAGSNARLRPNNLSVVDGPSGGVSGRFLRLEMEPDGTGTSWGQTVTFSFSSPVSNVSFLITDIDNVANGWGDRVRPSGTYIATAPLGSTVSFFGLPTTYRNSLTNRDYTQAEPGGNLRLTYPGTVSSVSFLYYNAVNTGSANHLINLADITFTPCPTPIALPLTLGASRSAAPAKTSDEPDAIVVPGAERPDADQG